MTWPPRWDKPHFKHDQPNSRVVKRNDRLKLVHAERLNKEKVRKRDKGCRFPLCGCKKFRRHTEVSHAEHKGMGGDPTGDRSQPDLMVLVCPFRHRENRVSIDRGTLRWRALKPTQGAEGPIVWEEQYDGRWIELAKERAVQSLEPLLAHQRARLRRLADMDI